MTRLMSSVVGRRCGLSKRGTVLSYFPHNQIAGGNQLCSTAIHTAQLNTQGGNVHHSHNLLKSMIVVTLLNPTTHPRGHSHKETSGRPLPQGNIWGATPTRKHLGGHSHKDTSGRPLPQGNIWGATPTRTHLGGHSHKDTSGGPLPQGHIWEAHPRGHSHKETSGTLSSNTPLMQINLSGRQFMLTSLRKC